MLDGAQMAKRAGVTAVERISTSSDLMPKNRVVFARYDGLIELTARPWRLPCKSMCVPSST